MLFQYQTAFINNLLILGFHHKVTCLIPCRQWQMASCVWLNHSSRTLSLYAFGIKPLYTPRSNLYKACCLSGRVQGKAEQFRRCMNRSQLLTGLNFPSKANNFSTKMQIITAIIVFQHPQVCWLPLTLNERTRVFGLKSSQCSCFCKVHWKPVGIIFIGAYIFLWKATNFMFTQVSGKIYSRLRLIYQAKNMLGLCEWAGA